MKSLKRILRLTGLIFLIVFACFGIAVMGGFPIVTQRKEDRLETKIELFEPNEEQKDMMQSEEKQ